MIEDVITKEQVEHLMYDIRNISHGGSQGPLGLEAVTMALAGEGVPGQHNVADGLYEIAEAIRDLSEAIREQHTPNES